MLWLDKGHKKVASIAMPWCELLLSLLAHCSEHSQQESTLPIDANPVPKQGSNLDRQGAVPSVLPCSNPPHHLVSPLDSAQLSCCCHPAPISSASARLHLDACVEKEIPRVLFSTVQRINLCPWQQGQT